MGLVNAWKGFFTSNQDIFEQKPVKKKELHGAPGIPGTPAVPATLPAALPATLPATLPAASGWPETEHKYVD